MKSILKLAVAIITAIIITCIWDVTSFHNKSEAATSNASSSPIDKPNASKIEILKDSYKNVPGGVYVYVTIRNNANEACRFVSLNVPFYDKNDNVVGSAQGVASDLEPGQTKVVNCIGLHISGANQYKVELEHVKF